MSGQRLDSEDRFGMNTSAFRDISVGKACQLIDGLVMGIMQAHPNLGAVEQYRQIAEALPDRVDENLQRGLLGKAQQHNDQATTAFLMLNLRTVFTVANRFSNGDPERDEELVCAGIKKLLERLPDINGKGQFHVQINYAVRDGIAEFLEQNEGVNPGFTRFGAARMVQEAANGLLADWPWGTTNESRLTELAEDLVSQESYPERAPGVGTVFTYLVGRMEERSDVPEEWIDVEDEVSRILRSEEVVRQMARLPERERQTLEMYFWGNKTLEEIGVNLGLTRDSARDLWKHALRALRHPTKSRALR